MIALSSGVMESSAMAKLMWSKLTPEQRSERQRIAALKGWDTRRKATRKKTKEILDTSR